MQGLDYSGLLKLGRDRDLRGRSFTLHLGPWEIAAVPYATVATLGGDPDRVRQLVDRCFVKQTLLCGNLEADDPASSRAGLEALGAALAAEKRRLDAVPESRAVVLCEVVCRWQEATVDAVEGLERSVGRAGRSARETRASQVLAEYRRRGHGVVSALLQLLVEDDGWGRDARRRLATLGEKLASRSGIPAGDLRHAAWFPDEVPQAETAEAAIGSATWGIP